MKKIKYFVACTILVFTSMGLYASECKMNYEEIDEFTGKKNRSSGKYDSWLTWYQIWSNFNEGLFLIISQNGDTFKITLRYNLPGRVDVAVKAGSELMIKLDNGNIVKLNSIKDSLPTVFSVKRITSQYNVEYNVKPEDLKKLAESPMAVIRTSLNEEKTFKIEKGFVKKIMADAACLAQGL